MAKRILLIRHGDDPTDDRVFAYCMDAGFQVDLRRPFQGDTLPETTDGVAGTAIYGGKFNVFEEDRHPFLREEARWIARCLADEVPMLGICQGAQQIARSLGAWVGPLPDNRYEFGYYPITPTPEGADLFPGPMYIPQAHFHMFDIPPGAVRLAGSALFPNQAFRYGDKVFGFQFHPEVTAEIFRRWQDADWAHFDKPGAQDRSTQDRIMARHDGSLDRWFNAVLERLFGRA
jgi:GMP synthase (glutamine-hydrolysing)